MLSSKRWYSIPGLFSMASSISKWSSFIDAKLNLVVETFNFKIVETRQRKMSQQQRTTTSFNFRSEHIAASSSANNNNNKSATNDSSDASAGTSNNKSTFMKSSLHHGDQRRTSSSNHHHSFHSSSSNSNHYRKKLSNSDVQEYLSSIASTCPIVDIGINLTNHQFKDSQETISQVLKRCQLVQVKCVILTGTSLRNSLESLSLISKFENHESGVKLKCTVGIHPHDAKSFKNISELEQVITSPQHNSSICMVGECGLDYNRMFSPKQVQIHCFKEQLRMAIRLQKPIFCHERDAHSDFVECVQSVMKEFGNSTSLPPLVVHCFTGTRNEAKKYIDMGFYIGLTGCVCMEERGKELREILRDGIIPRDKLLIETDSPFMLPPLSGNGHSVWKYVTGGRRNEPCLLPHVVNTIAECWNMTENKQALEKQLTENTARFLMMADVKELIGSNH
ncbi:hypothetical protein C9374_011596 [Naegleria lovaniensis]|uniref:Uncharacterized protein n=1 Tax=Naegleria lovaniensis TaxID=51637 RepID=A0AA88GCF9_NAELO|nr:uncharacterized protein C9374_011596 [Naegleria lovaniensis]KAG2373931.1 hypothetical protein C9374_011596 [Naegleria lovaniensis]